MPQHVKYRTRYVKCFVGIGGVMANGEVKTHKPELLLEKSGCLP